MTFPFCLHFMQRPHYKQKRQSVSDLLTSVRKAVYMVFLSNIFEMLPGSPTLHTTLPLRSWFLISRSRRMACSTGVQPLHGNKPHSLLCVGSLAARWKVAISGTANRLNYCEFYSIYVTNNVAAGWRPMAHRIRSIVVGRRHIKWNVRGNDFRKLPTDRQEATGVLAAVRWLEERIS
jgi:hypothetical protein